MSCEGSVKFIMIASLGYGTAQGGCTNTEEVRIWLKCEF